MQLQFNDSASSRSFWPLTATRNVADMRIGVLTTREKWQRLLADANSNAATIIIDPAVIPTADTTYAIDEEGNVIVQDTATTIRIQHLQDLFQQNDWAIRQDFAWITKGRASAPIPASNTIIGEGQVFLEPGASVECSLINATTGPVYIGKNATVMEGCLIRGPFALCEGATLKMGTKIYGATTIGPNCVAGGEIKNSILFANSNKAHDGYLGDSVIGEWCNLGAGTTNSNVKNTAGEVKLWNQLTGTYTPVGLKAGLIMGDYSRAAINTSFNTGTVVGVCCNIFGSGFPPKLVPHFTWGDQGYELHKALQDISNWKQLKGQSITTTETDILTHLYQSTQHEKTTSSR